MDVQDRHAPSRSRSSHGKEIFPLDTNWKKDLERHRIIDLLQDRERSTFAAWLHEHPTVRVISRDRATDYAAAAREAAPQALQVADRYHLVHNLADALELFLARCRTEIRRASQQRLPEDEPLPEVSPASLPPPAHLWRQQPTEDERNAPTTAIGRSERTAIDRSPLCTRHQADAD